MGTQDCTTHLCPCSDLKIRQSDLQCMHLAERLGPWRCHAVSYSETLRLQLWAGQESFSASHETEPQPVSSPLFIQGCCPIAFGSRLNLPWYFIPRLCCCSNFDTQKTRMDYCLGMQQAPWMLQLWNSAPPPPPRKHPVYFKSHYRTSRSLENS